MFELQLYSIWWLHGGQWCDGEYYFISRMLNNHLDHRWLNHTSTRILMVNLVDLHATIIHMRIHTHNRIYRPCWIANPSYISFPAQSSYAANILTYAHTYISKTRNINSFYIECMQIAQEFMLFLISNWRDLFKFMCVLLRILASMLKGIYKRIKSSVHL